MPSIPTPIRGAKELIDSRQPYLKPSTKEREKKGKKSKSQKARKPKGEEKANAKEGTSREEQKKLSAGHGSWSNGYPKSSKCFLKDISSQKRDF